MRFACLIALLVVAGCAAPKPTPRGGVLVEVPGPGRTPQKQPPITTGPVISAPTVPQSVPQPVPQSIPQPAPQTMEPIIEPGDRSGEPSVVITGPSAPSYQPPQAPGGQPVYLGAEYHQAIPVGFSALRGWSADQHHETLHALKSVCDSFMKRDQGAPIKGPTARDGQPIGGYVDDWAGPCHERQNALRTGQARAYLEFFFQPVHISSNAEEAKFTGYYEPELKGSRHRGGPYQFPLYRKPPDLVPGQKYLSRRKIDAGALAGRGLELFWIDDPVDVFFLQIQGSGRVRLPDNTVARVSFAGKNGHAYRSIGKELARRGELKLHEASADGIKDWARRNPHKMWDVFAHNPSYVFFAENNSLAPGAGPVGSFGTPLPALRAIAVDPSVYPLGVPVWIETNSPMGPLERLMLALDTGGAIKGTQRADIFWGSGAQAGHLAGRTNHPGRMTVLLPKTVWTRLAGAGV